MKRPNISSEEPFVPVEEIMTVNILKAVDCLNVPGLYIGQLPHLHMARKLLDVFIKDVEQTAERLGL